MSRLVEQDQQLLRQENERLQMEVRRAREDLLQSRETVTPRSTRPIAAPLVPLTWSRFSHAQVRQLDATVLSLSQSSLEQENAALKRELAAQKELSSVRIIQCLQWPRLVLWAQVLPVLPERRGRTRTRAAGEPPAGERSTQGADVSTLHASNRRADISLLTGHVGFLPVFHRLNEGLFPDAAGSARGTVAPVASQDAEGAEPRGRGRKRPGTRAFYSLHSHT